MTSEPAVDRRRLEAALAAIGPAHHEAFLETDGIDPEWPLWYAQHGIAELRGLLLRPELTESRLVWAMVSADDAHTTEGSGAPWPEFYADYLIRNLSG